MYIQNDKRAMRSKTDSKDNFIYSLFMSKITVFVRNLLNAAIAFFIKSFK